MYAQFSMKRFFLLLLILLPVAAAGHCRKEKAPEVACELRYNADGKFKILQLTDTHFIAGDPRSERALQNINAVLDAEKPDFVIHTGDIIFGNPADESARQALQPLVDRGIPFAVVLGNHDSDFGLTRSEMYDLVRATPGNVNTPADTSALFGYSNDIITLSGAKGPEHVFYLFDSGSYDTVAGIKGYSYIRANQIDWYRRASAYFTGKNGGKPVPSVAFFHIPFPEYTLALHGDPKKGRAVVGNYGEEPCPPKFNSGLYLAMRECGDVFATVTGHDHDNDFVMLWQGFLMIYGRFSGCDTVYNHLKPNGARVFEFTEGDDGVRTWIRLSDGRTEQETYLFPSMKTLSDAR